MNIFDFSVIPTIVPHKTLKTYLAFSGSLTVFVKKFRIISEYFFPIFQISSNYFWSRPSNFSQVCKVFFKTFWIIQFLQNSIKIFSQFFFKILSQMVLVNSQNFLQVSSKFLKSLQYFFNLSNNRENFPNIPNFSFVKYF